MSEQNSHVEDQAFIKNSVAAALQIGLLFLMAAWCIKIISPFIGIVAWAAIIAVAVFPMQCKLARMLGGKDKCYSFKASKNDMITKLQKMIEMTVFSTSTV